MRGIPSRLVIIACTLVIFPFFFIGGPAYQSPRSYGELWNLGHVLFFALFAILLYYHLLPGYVSSFAKICLTFILVILLGGGIEFAQQGLNGRSVGWDDIFRDVAGAVIVFFWRGGERAASRVLGGTAKMAACLLLAVCLVPLASVLVDEYQARRDFPLLAGFESKGELERWEESAKIRQVMHPVRSGKYAAEIQLTTDTYSGVSLVYFPGDWRGKKALAFSVFNPGVPTELHYRVHDRFHAGENQQFGDRYNGMTALVPGWNDIVVPMDAILKAPVDREMDLAHIRGFGIFVIKQPEDRLLYLDDVRLFD